MAGKLADALIAAIRQEVTERAKPTVLGGSDFCPVCGEVVFTNLVLDDVAIGICEPCNLWISYSPERNPVSTPLKLFGAAELAPIEWEKGLSS